MTATSVGCNVAIWKTILLSCAAGMVYGCVWISHRLDVMKVDPKDGVTIETPVKAHLKDGSTIVFRSGVAVSAGALHGQGDRYDLTLAQPVKINTVPLDDVVGMETFVTKVNSGESVIVSSALTAGTVAGGIALFKAIFGSCPTVYSNDGKVEEAELFSSSIAPLLEARDLHRLQTQPDADGLLHLEVRNEAMETHYINHLQLIEVAHTANETVLPDDQDHPLIVGETHPPVSVVNRAGQDVRATLLEADGKAYSTSEHAIEAVSVADMDDWLDIIADVPAGSKNIAVTVRARNSLLNTILLYDVMLGRSGARALDWVGKDLARISTAVELGRWYEKRAGLHVSVWRNGAYQEVARIPDSGPIFWHDTAATIPVQPRETSLRLRLSFTADQWRIDRIAVASDVRQGMPKLIGVSEVMDSNGAINAAARERIRSSDDQYLQTSPGQRFFVQFNVGSPSPGMSRTFLLSSQGYYIEWIRGSWIQKASAANPFIPDDDALLSALHKWGSVRDSFEKEFMNARVPVH